MPTVSGIPTNVVGITGSTEISLTWSAPANDGGSAITDYVVEFNNGVSWAVFADGTSGATEATVTGLLNNTSYTFRVKAVNGEGTSAVSATSSSVFPRLQLLVTVAELKKYMDIKLSNIQAEAAEFVLEGLQSELETYLRRPILVRDFVETRVIESNYVGVPMSPFFYNYDFDTTGSMNSFMEPPGTRYFENTPVVSIASIVVTHSNNTTPYTLVNGQDYFLRPYGVEGFPFYSNSSVVVSYAAGLDGENIKMFRLLILRAATREMQNMHDDVVGIKDLETRNVGPLTTGFSDTELASLDRWRRKRI